MKKGGYQTASVVIAQTRVKRAREERCHIVKTFCAKLQECRRKRKVISLGRRGVHGGTPGHKGVYPKQDCF